MRIAMLRQTEEGSEHSTAERHGQSVLDFVTGSDPFRNAVLRELDGEVHSLAASGYGLTRPQ